MDIALDLGTSKFRIGELGNDAICAEPATVAYDVQGRPTVGAEAEQLVGRAPQGITVVHPISAGVVKDFDAAVALIRHAIGRVQGSKMAGRPNLTVSIPTGITIVERRAVEDAAREAGAKQVHLFESVIASAIGAGLPVGSPHGALVLNLGAGVTQAAVVSMGGVVNCRTASFGGRDLDEAIVELVRKEYAFLIGIKTAEELKCTAGNSDGEASFVVRGRSLTTGLPETLQVRRTMIEMQVNSYCEMIVGLLVNTLESSPPELVGDFMDSGIVMMGGGARLHGLLERLRQKTDMPIVVAEEAETCVIRGLQSSASRRRRSLDTGRDNAAARGNAGFQRLTARVRGMLPWN